MRQAQDLEQDLAPQPTPLFLYVASQAPHAHHTGAPRKAYGAVDATENGLDYGAGRREVAALVVCLDDLVGHLRQTLVEQDMWDDTLFIFDSDQSPDRGSCGPYLMTLTTHNYIVDGNTNAVLQPGECLGAMGD